METETKMGRPNGRKDANLYDGPLYRLLAEKLPSEFIKGANIDTDKLSTVIGYARFTVYQWLHRGRVTPKAASLLLKISNDTEDTQKKGLLTRDDLVPFVLGF